jgi:hypothetical protein
VPGHIAANRALVADRLEAVKAALPGTAYEIAQHVYGEQFNEATATWLLSKTRAYLIHLEQLGLAACGGETPEQWSVAA